MHPLLQDRLRIVLPLIQAPMAGTATPALAAAVSEAGGLGSISVGAVDATAARTMIRQTRLLTDRPFNVNVFCHRPPRIDLDRQAAWLDWLAPHFARLGATPPSSLKEIYGSFVDDDAMLGVLLEERPAVVSFHFGLPPQDRIDALRRAGIVLLATATNRIEAQQIAAAGIDAVVAQGYEAGGHRGMFDPDAPDAQLSTLALIRLLARTVHIPLIAAGGIMDGAGIAAALSLGAVAAQLGTAFIACPESAADAAFRSALFSEAAHRTQMTRLISGRLARCLANDFTDLTGAPAAFPDYPLPYDAGKALNAAGKAVARTGFGAQWAGQGAPLARALPAAELVGQLAEELERLQ